MELRRGEEELTVMEAVDNLSNMSEIDLKTSLETEEEPVATAEINWRDPRQALKNENAIKETFRVLHRYLQNIIRKDRNSLKDPQTQKGIQAIMLLAHEAVSKMDRFAALYPKVYKPISHLKEYTDLQKYYKQQILKEMTLKEEQEDWEVDVQQEFAGIEEEKRGLQDLEAVRKDQNYELFFIKNENDKPYFNRNLLRHIRLVGNFDEFVTKVEGEDPLLSLRERVDHEFYEGAKELLKLTAPYMDIFYKEGMHHKDRPLVANINKAIMALRMAANPKHLIENQSFKSCLEYYSDFHRFLRASMEDAGYQKRISGEVEETPFYHAFINLIHAFCFFFFFRIEPRKEALQLVHKMVTRGDEMRGPHPKEKAAEKQLQLWNDILDGDESLRYLLKHYPNGPILRILDAFREEEEYEGYDPLTHFNFPSQLFTFSQNEAHITVLRIPCPTKQIYINKAMPLEEFFGFLRYYRHELKPDKHLLVNLQDRTSWEEFARCRALEEITHLAEFYDTFFLLGLPTNTSFYFQEDAYGQVGGAPVFMEQFKQQLLSKEDCGFHYPEAFQIHVIAEFIDLGLKATHELFFEGKTSLTRLERQSFIDIFYLLFTLKMADSIGVDSISFTCKDAIDIGMAQSALLYGFLKMVSDAKPWKKEEKDQLLWILYSPALFIRDRAIQQNRFRRAIAALQVVHAACLQKQEEILKGLNHLYSKIKFPFDMKNK